MSPEIKEWLVSFGYGIALAVVVGLVLLILLACSPVCLTLDEMGALKGCTE